MSEAKEPAKERPSGSCNPARQVCAALVVFVVVGWLMAHSPARAFARAEPASKTSERADGAEQRHQRYGGSASCRACHEEEYQLWENSHHALAQRPPAPQENPAFEPEHTFRFGEETVKPSRKVRGYEIEVNGVANTQQVFKVQSVLGVSPLRQFLVEFPGGRLQAMDASYDPRSNQWFSVYAGEDRRPGEWGHWTGRGMNWNSMCAGCHNTKVEKNYDPANDSYKTTMAETGVGCEACHGPLRAHNKWQKQFQKSGQKDPTLPKWSPQQVLDNCGYCHARRGDLTGEFKPGEDFLNHMILEVPDLSEKFYADGQVREEDYEYAAFLGSRMHWRGVGCSDCHNPHSTKTILPGNWLCMKCHNGSFTNAPVVDPVAHSHHKVFGYDSKGRLVNNDLMAYRAGPVKEAGGECVNCHMPQTVYMQRHWRHDHGFTSPDPQLTKQLGIPNACNRCHRDQSSEWATKYCEEWFGSKMERPARQRARTIAAARKGDPAARAGLLDMLRTNEIPYWRAVAGGLLGTWADESPVQNELRLALRDTNALVRVQCVRALESVAEAPGVGVSLTNLLSDSTLAVRLGAAWAVGSKLDLSQKAGRELQRSLDLNSDQPVGQMQAGALDLARGKPVQAAEHYRKAVGWDPSSAVAHHDYAFVLSGLSRGREAVEQLEKACRLEPTNAAFQYELGLGWNELGQTEKAIECLRESVRLDTGDARAWFNLGLALNASGQSEQALEALRHAETTDRADPRIPYAQATILARLGKIEEARNAARRVLELEPGSAAAHELLRNLGATN